MKATRSVPGQVRPKISHSQFPHSVLKRAKQITVRTAAELFRYLCEKTIGFGRGSVEVTYKALMQVLGVSWSSIARAAKFLREAGDIIVERLRDGSYRWLVLLEPSDILSDPHGLYHLREPREAMASENDPHVTGDMRVHSAGDMRVMSPVTCGKPHDEQAVKPCKVRLEASFEVAQKESLNIPLKHTYLNIQQQSDMATVDPVTTDTATAEELDDETVDHKNLLKRLLELGMKSRMARKMARKYDHALIASALERIAMRKDIANPAGYLIRELEDGGYEDNFLPVPISPSAPTPASAQTKQTSDYKAPMTLKASPIIYPSNKQYRAEQDRLAFEDAQKKAVYKREVERLLERFATLSEYMRTRLKKASERYLKAELPDTPRKLQILQDPNLKRMAFKTVVERFFEYQDSGITAELALEKIAAWVKSSFRQAA